MGSLQIKVLTIRPNSEEERESIRYVMRETGLGRASQAMLFACNAYRITNERNNPVFEEMKQKHNEKYKQQQQHIHNLQEENASLRNQLAEIEKLLENIQGIIHKS